MSKNYVLHSSQESRDKGVTSLLAILETLIFVALTWWVAYYYNTYTHIYTAIAIAPFLLLKTPESSDKAIEWFLYQHDIDEKEYYYKDKFFWLILLLSTILFFVISYFYATKILINYEGVELSFLSILLGLILIGVGLGAAVGVAAGVGVVGAVGIVGIVVGAAVVAALRAAVRHKINNKILKNIILLLLSLILLLIGAGLGLGLFLRSLFIKFFATFFYALIHPKKTFFAISTNWNEQIAVNDIFYTPELLPNIHKRNDYYQLSSFIAASRNSDKEEKIIS